MSAIAIGRYAMRIGEINREKYAYGGVPGRGGKFAGRSHAQGGTPFRFKGNEFEAEVDELAVIRTKDAPRTAVFKAVGTQSQIASALNREGGGVDFAPGGKIKKFAYGGNLGESLQAPVFIPSTNNTYINSSDSLGTEKFQALLERVEQLAVEQSNRIDRLQVVQETETVTTAQRKEAKRVQIGTL
jgi:hypothetical protein